jgi:hypothetical protein
MSRIRGLTPEMERLVTPQIKRQAFWYALKASLWETTPTLVLSIYVSSLLYGKILARPASALTTVERGALFAAVLGVAAVAAVLKGKNALTYGVTELGFAMAVTWALVSSQLRAEPVANGLALLAAVYLTSRAFLNIADGFRQQAAGIAEVERLHRANESAKVQNAAATDVP